VKYTITLTRSLLISQSENESRSTTPNSQIVPTLDPPILRLPFQASLPSSTSSLIPFPHSPLQPALPLKNGPRTFFEPGSLRQSSSAPSIAESFERKATTFDRIRADRHACIDYNCAFRKVEIAKSTVTQTSTSFSFKDMLFPSSLGSTSKH
jgi:hypothetical protein